MSSNKSRMKYLVLLLFVYILGSEANKQLFDDGKEYRYSYLGLFTTGVEEPTSYASSYMLLGTLKVQGNAGNSFTAKLENMMMALYNGKWQYFPIPKFDFFRDDRLSTLEEPFKVTLSEEGKFKTLIMNDQEPEYASNIKRGLATYLQLNFSRGLDSMQIFKENDLTTMGECPTSYEIMPSSSNAITVGAFRNHADCPEIPKRVRHGTKEAFYQCSNDATRDIVNSTSYATYDISVEDDNHRLDRLTVFSSILYWPFTTKNQYLYTWYNVTLALTGTSSIESPINSPENPESHEDLSFIFEQSDYQDPEEETPDLKVVEPLYFHQTVTESESENMEALTEKAKIEVQKMAKSFYEMQEFQEEDNSPIKISKALSFLSYDSLTKLYKSFRSQEGESTIKTIESQLFIDGLVNAGTSATVLVIRDIILEEIGNEKMLERVLPTFPSLIRLPSEALSKEFDVVFDLLPTTNISKTTKRMLEFSLAIVVSRGCERNLCVTSKLLDKYVKYFETKFDENTHFDEQTTAVLGLRNLGGLGNSLDKILQIAVGNLTASKAARVQAIWSLGPLFYKNPEETTQTLLRVFYNRKETCEIRTSVFGLIMTTNPDKRILHEIAYFLWSEPCPYTTNFVRSTFDLLSKSTVPCSKMSSYAKTIIKYLPPGKIDPTKTASYLTEYFDDAHGFGRSFYLTMQKSGTANLPVSIYLGSSYTFGGFASSAVGIFIRMEGLEKFISKQMDSAAADKDTAQKILNILSELKVTKKKATPLNVEFTVVYLNRVIYHYAADEKSLFSSIIEATKQLKGVQKSVNFLQQKSIMYAETLYQQPLEVGIPVSIYSSAISFGINHINSKTESEANGKKLSINLDANLKSNFYATTKISNHLPVFGTVHSAGLYRTMIIDQHRNVSFSFDKSQGKKLDYILYPPTAENPSIIQSYATAFVSLTSENPTAQDNVDLLEKSCKTCKTFSPVSMGPGVSQTAEIVKIPLVPNGLRYGIRKIMCEKHISKSRFFQKLQHFFGSGGKNYGLFGTSYEKLTLATQQVFDYFIIWPNPEPCGFEIYLSKEFSNSSHIVEKVEGTINLQSETSGIIQLENTLKIVYQGPSPPPTKTVSFHAKIVPEKDGLQKLHFKYSIDRQANDKTLVGCADILNFASPQKTDPLGFEDENEPRVNQTISYKSGTVSGSILASDNMNCPNDRVDIKMTAVAERSNEQLIEVNGQSQSQDLSYILCQMEKQSGKWSKKLTPPTPECLQVVLDQTGLRKSNITIKYKVGEKVEKWTRPLAHYFLAFLSAYLVDPEQDKVHQQHHEHAANGEIEIDVNLKKQEPVMDIHFIGSNSAEEKHYHDIDLDLIPNAIKFQPAPSRISPLTQLLYKFGFLGSCAVSANSVVTFDNLKYASQLSSTCETLIASDCSESPTFLVTAKAAANSKVSVELTVRGDQPIQISENGVTSNGSPVTFDNNGVYSAQNLRIKKRGDEIGVRVSGLGFQLRYAGGHFIQIITGSSRYRGLTCGLCGNFDTSPGNDLQGPTSPACPLSSMSDAWTIKAGTCEKTHAC